VLIVTWSFSHRPAFRWSTVFMIGTPNQRTESVLRGMTAAFEFFGCVANEVWWDNPKTIALSTVPAKMPGLPARESEAVPARGDELPQGNSSRNESTCRAGDPPDSDGAVDNAIILDDLPSVISAVENGTTIGADPKHIGGHPSTRFQEYLNKRT